MEFRKTPDEPPRGVAGELPTRDVGHNLPAWLLGCAMVYATLFGIGELCFGRIASGVLLLILATVCAGLIYAHISHPSRGFEASPAD